MKDLRNKVVLITGAGRGIGRLMAIDFAKERSKLVLWALHEEGLKKVKKEIEDCGAQAWIYVCDVSQKNQIAETAKKVKQEVGKVDVLINNAGIVTGKPFMECSDAQIRKTMDINVMAHFWTVRAFLPDMLKENNGHLVTISSAAGEVGVNSLSDYCASKFAAVGFLESLRMELHKQRKDGVKTTIVCPYYIDTGMFEGVKSRFSLFLPILHERYVADKVLAAIKKDQSVLHIPRILYTFPILRLLPTAVFDKILNIVGISSTMDEFVGHHH